MQSQMTDSLESGFASIVALAIFTHAETQTKSWKNKALRQIIEIFLSPDIYTLELNGSRADAGWRTFDVRSDARGSWELFVNTSSRNVLCSAALITPDYGGQRADPFV